jgi:sensory rhodopsin
MYMREYWVQVHKSPVVYRYIDWTITVPLQMIEFNLILKAAGVQDGGGFWRLLVGTICMLVFGYIGETTPGFEWPGFILGLCGWGFILFEIFAGPSSKAVPAAGPVADSFKNMRIIVSAGWSIYPAGYFFGFLTGMADQVTLNVIYNVADLVNKICFVLACWSCAKEDSEPKGTNRLLA